MINNEIDIKQEYITSQLNPELLMTNQYYNYLIQCWIIFCFNTVYFILNGNAQNNHS